MSYIIDNLLPSEEIQYEWKIHNFYTFLMSIWVLVWLIVLISWGWIIGIAIMLPFIYNIFFILTVEIAVTNKRVLYKTWVISRNVFELQLSQIESIRLDQSIFQRIIWAGRLIVSWTWWHSGVLEKIKKPTDMRKVIYSIIEK